VLLSNSATINVLSISPQYFEKMKDSELMLQFRKTRHDLILSVLFERYKHLVFGVCLKYFEENTQSEDTMMEVFRMAFSRMETEQITNFKNWVYTIAKNRCIRATRTESKIVSIEDSQAFNPNEHCYELNTDEFMEVNQHLREINREKFYEAFESLRKTQRDCIFAFYFEKKTYKQIAAMGQYSEREVKTNIQNGKLNLKKSLIRLLNMEEDQDF